MAHLTPAQIEAARAIKRQLARVEAAHRDCPEVRALHDLLAALVDTFRDQLTPDQLEEFGGGTPKTDPGP